MGESLIIRKGGGGGGLEVAEPLKNLKVATGQTILPGTFVEIKPELGGILTPGSSANTGSNSKAVVVSPGKAILVFDDIINSNHLYVRVIDFNETNNTITTYGAPVLIRNVSMSNKPCDIHYLDTNKALVSYESLSGGDNYGYANVVQASGTTMSVSSAIQTTGFGAAYVHAQVISPSKAVLTFRDNALKLNVRMLSISALTITLQTAVGSAVFGTTNVDLSRTLVLDSSKAVLFSIDMSNNNILRYAIINISGNTPTLTTSFQTLISGYNQMFYPILLETNKIFMAYRFISESHRYGIITIDGNTLTPQTTITVPNTYPKFQQNVWALTPNKVVISNISDVSPNASQLHSFDVDGNTVVADITNLPLGNYITSYSNIMRVSENKVMHFQREGSTLRIMFINPFKDVYNTASETVNGLTKTGGTAGQTIEVFVNG
jgi:hypothetical protein